MPDRLISVEECPCYEGDSPSFFRETWRRDIIRSLQMNTFGPPLYVPVPDTTDYSIDKHYYSEEEAQQMREFYKKLLEHPA